MRREYYLCKLVRGLILGIVSQMDETKLGFLKSCGFWSNTLKEQLQTI